MFFDTRTIVTEYKFLYSEIKVLECKKIWGVSEGSRERERVGDLEQEKAWESEGEREQERGGERARARDKEREQESGQRGGEINKERGRDQ